MKGYNQMSMQKKRIEVGTILYTIVIIMAATFIGCGDRTEGASSVREVESADKLKWVDYKTGLQMALEEKKPVLINFFAEWCHYCKKMDNDTYGAIQIIDYLNENFVTIKINTDKERNLASSYKVMGLPTTWFLEYDATRIGPLSGYITPADLIGVLKYIKGNHHKNMTLKEFLNKG